MDRLFNEPRESVVQTLSVAPGPVRQFPHAQGRKYPAPACLQPWLIRITQRVKEKFAWYGIGMQNPVWIDSIAAIYARLGPPAANPDTQRVQASLDRSR